MKSQNLLITALVCGSILVGAASPAFAAEPATVKSNADVEFVEDEDGGNNEIPKPPTGGGTDPEEKPQPPVDPGENNDGKLRIDYASSFDFRTQKISATEQTYFANVQEWKKGDTKSYTPNFVQVTDKRAGNNSKGWNLTVSMPTPLTNAATKHELKKAKVTLVGRQINAIGSDENNLPALVSNDGASVDINSDAAVLMSANAGNGWGTTQQYFATAEGTPEDLENYKDNEVKEFDQKGNMLGLGDDAVKLTVPSGSKANTGQYSAKVVWTLNDGPANA